MTRALQVSAGELEVTVRGPGVIVRGPDVIVRGPEVIVRGAVVIVRWPDVIARDAQVIARGCGSNYKSSEAITGVSWVITRVSDALAATQRPRIPPTWAVQMSPT
jgi:hypothetical protein